MNTRKNISSGTPWEAKAGYSRAVRIGNMIFVSGTTASDERGDVIGVGDPYAQALYIFEKIERALHEAGASLADVVRTRIYVTDISQWEAVARAHGQFFGDVLPANTLIEVSKLVDPAHLVEIEADAYLETES